MIPFVNMGNTLNKSLLQGFRLGGWLVKPMANKLTGPDGDVHLEPKVMDTLVCLASEPGQVVSRQRLLEQVWERVVINEETLTRTVSELRSALGDTTSVRRYIKTIPKRGYMLIASVEMLGVTDVRQGVREHEEALAIAVLPFKNLSSETENEQFADGLTEELICTIGQINGLHIAASTSAFSFKNKTRSITEISDALGVSYLLEGSVRKSNDRVRITTQLIRVSDGFQLWASSFDRIMADIFEIQEEIAQSVVDALKIRLGIGDDTTFVNAPVENLNAYELYLNSRLQYQNEQHSMFYAGLDEAEQAIALVPDYAEANGLAAWIRTLNTISEPYYKHADKIRASYEAALSTNPFQEEALMAKAVDLRWQTWDWAAVKAQFELAQASSPNCPHVLTQFGARFYRDLCLCEQAQELLERAVSLDPINAAPRTSLAFNLRYQGRFEEALEQLDKALSINPTHGYAILGKALSLMSLQRFEEADRIREEVERQYGKDDLLALNLNGRIHASAGNVRAARRVADKVARLSELEGGEKHIPLVGWIELLLGNTRQGIDWLSLGLDKQISQVLNTRPFVTMLGGGVLENPDVQAFLRKMNMDDASIADLQCRGVVDGGALVELPRASSS